MPAKSGASHAGAAFLSIVLGAFIKNLLDMHASLVTDASARIGGVVTLAPGISLSDDPAGFLFISTVVAFLWGLAYHHSRHSDDSDQPKDYVTDNQFTTKTSGMSTKKIGTYEQSARAQQPVEKSSQSGRTGRIDDEQVQSRLKRDLEDSKTRLDDIHDRLIDAGNRDHAQAVTSVLQSVTTTKRVLENTVQGERSVDDATDSQRRGELTASQTELLDASDELVAQIRYLHHLPVDEIDTEAFETCERLLSDLERALKQHDSTGEIQ